MLWLSLSLATLYKIIKQQHATCSVRQTKFLDSNVANWNSNSVAITGNNATRLDLCELEGVAQDLCKASLSINSRKAYQTAQKQYFQFFPTFGISLLPATQQVLICSWQMFHHSTARSSLSAVRHLHISMGTRYCKGLKRKKLRGQDTRLLITPWI